MPLTSDHKQAIDSGIQRHVGGSAIKQIHRLIEEEKADELKGRRFAAAATSVLLLVVLCRSPTPPLVLFLWRSWLERRRLPHTPPERRACLSVSR